MITINVNDYQFLVKPNLSLIETCKFIGIFIPRFCYHEKLSVAASCRMCVVEIEKVPKPVTACSADVSSNLSIYTNTPLVKKARENILEALLLNHPLDCPICDQAGECDLQDQVKIFGSFYSRFYIDTKRGVEDKNCGPLIKTIMTRCIHCTRCVRFGSEVAGVDYLGTLNRGISTEIGGYISKMFNSEISGNVIDLCPVGALTSNSYAFKMRPWELRTIDSIDILDSFGSNIYLNYKESDITRILPKINEDLNENLISDKIRFGFDAVSSPARLNEYAYKTFLKNKFSNILSSKKQKTLFLINETIDLELLILLKNLSYFNEKIEVRSVENFNNKKNFYISWIFDKIKDISSESKICFLLTSNIKIENALLNTKLRSKFFNKDFDIFSFGLISKSNYQFRHVNLTQEKIISFLEGKNTNFIKLFLNSNPLFFFGESFNKRSSISSTFFTNIIKTYLPTAAVFNVNSNCNTAALSFLGLKTLDKNSFYKASTFGFYNLNNNFRIQKIISCYSIFNSSKLIVILNSFKTFCNAISDSLHNKITPNLIAIPTLNFFEFDGVYLNLEERPQQTQSLKDSESSSCLKTYLIKFFIDQKGFLFQNQIVYNLKKKEFISLISIKTIKSFIEFKFIFEILKKFIIFTSIKKDYSFGSFSKLNVFTKYSKCFKYPYKSTIDDFYISNSFLRHSATMIACSRESRKLFDNF